MTTPNATNVYKDDNTTLVSYGTLNGLNNQPLPVQVTDLTVDVKELNAEVHWKTQTEINNYGFEIQRRSIPWTTADTSVGKSEEQESQWTKVGFVQGAGTTSALRDYSYTDKYLLPGKYAYRLKQIDNNGTFEIIGGLEVQVGSLPIKFLLAQNYPNPFNPTTKIQYDLPEESQIRLTVHNLLGQIVGVIFDGIQHAGRYEINWRPASASSGVYFLVMEAKGQTENQTHFRAVVRMLLLR
jgi:hypothetical protein